MKKVCSVWMEKGESEKLNKLGENGEVVMSEVVPTSGVVIHIGFHQLGCGTRLNHCVGHAHDCSRSAPRSGGLGLTWGLVGM